MTTLLHQNTQKNQKVNIETIPDLNYLKSLESNKANTQQLSTKNDKQPSDYDYQDMLNRIDTSTSSRHCGKWKLPEEKSVKLHSRLLPDGAKHLYYAGLMLCGNSWKCKVCSKIRAKEAAADIDLIVNRAVEEGKYISMITYTIPHKRGDSLKFLLSLINKIYALMKNTRLYKRLKKEVEYFGDIKALEILHGGSGFHPHFHVAFITDKPLTEELQNKLWLMYKFAFEKVCPTRQINKKAFDVNADCWEELSNYMTKWGLPQELTQEQLKTDKKGQDFWSMLEEANSGSNPAIERVKEYCRETKSKRRIVFSDGLKAYAELQKTKEAAEAEAAEEVTDKIEIDFKKNEWNAILWKEARGKFIKLYKKEAAEALKYLKEITGEYNKAHPYEDTRWNVNNKMPCLSLYNLPSDADDPSQ